MRPIPQGFLLGVLLAAGACQKTTETKDENRPYEFGFVIDGEQHRYEKKDEKGIIMGEYGFITADGVYHVTVYATDEEGNFIILKTRNIRIGLKMVNMASSTGTTTTTTTTTKKPAVRKLSGQQGCSGCLIPDRQDSQENAQPKNIPLQKQTPENPIIPSTMFEPPLLDNRYKSPQTVPNADVKSSLTPIDNRSPNYGGVNNIPTKPDSSKPPVYRPPDDRSKPGPNKVNPSSYSGQSKPNSPVSGIHQTTKSSADLNLPVPKESPILPESLTKQILTNTEMKILEFMARLYKFNYTLSYHGHEEEGDVEGNKRGSYFNIGRDGYQRNVAYIANEFGFQPVITLEKQDPSKTPNEKTEKDLTQLKGSEFIWFYDKIKS